MMSIDHNILFNTPLSRWHKHTIVNKISDKAVIVNKTVKEVINAVSNSDPSKNKDFTIWLFRELGNNWFDIDNVNYIKNLLTLFGYAKRRLKYQDIYKYNLPNLESELHNTLNPTIKEQEPVNGEIIYYDGPLGRLTVPTTKEASQRLGNGTVWCVSASNYNDFEKYTNDFFVWKASSNRKFFFFVDYNSGKGETIDDSGITCNSKQIYYFRKKHPVLKQLFELFEKKILDLNDPRAACNYAIFVLKDRWPEAEMLIFKEGHYSQEYIRHLIKKEPHPYFSTLTRGLQPDKDVKMDFGLNLVSKLHV